MIRPWRRLQAARISGIAPPGMTTALNPGARGADPIEISPGHSMAEHQRMAVRDVAEAARLWNLCWTLGWLDIKLRYRGSMLGPFWLTLSTAVMVAALGVLYSTLFHMDAARVPAVPGRCRRSCGPF